MHSKWNKRMQPLRYVAGLILIATIGTGCATATHIDESPVPVSPLATWQPSPSEIFPNASAGTGIISITDNCVYLMLDNQTRTLLVWIEPTSWDEATQTIEFVDFQGEQIALRDGDRVRPGGMSIKSPDILENAPFVLPPDPACQADDIFAVNSVVEFPHN